MFFSFSLATYYTFSSLIRNRHKFLGSRPAHYILPAGCFGQLSPFNKDHKRQPSLRELPLEDASSLLRVTPERRLFLDEIYNNFLDLTLLDQQDLFVDRLLREFENCLHRGLSSRIIINDVDRFQSLDTNNDPNAAFIFEGHFGILLSPPEEYSCDTETTQTNPKRPFNTIAFQKSLTPHRNESFISLRSTIRNFNTKSCTNAPITDSSHPLVNSAYHQSLPVVVGTCVNHLRHIASAPPRYRFVVQHKTLSTKISFCRRVGQCISYHSIPVTFRVTKLSLDTKRNCVSLVICNFARPAAIRRSNPQQLFTEPGNVTIKRAVRFSLNNVGPSVCLNTPFRENIPLVNATFHRSLPATDSGCVEYPQIALSAPASTFSVKRTRLNTTVSFCRRVGQYISYRSIPVTVTKISLATKRNCVSVIICKANQSVATKGLHNEGKKIFFQQPLAITSLVRDASDGPSRVDESIPSNILSSHVTTKAPVENPSLLLDSNDHPNHGPFTGRDTIQLGTSPKFHRGRLDFSNFTTTSPPPRRKTQDLHNRPALVADERLTPVGGKAAATPPSSRRFLQRNQQLSVAMGFDNGSSNGTVMYEPNTGRSTSNLGAGVIGSNNSGEVTGASNFNELFGWGMVANWGNVGFFQPRGSRHNGHTLRNPFANAVSGASNVQLSPWNRDNRQTQQADPWAPLWNTSHQSSERRISGTRDHRLNRKQSSYRLLNNPTSNQATGTSIWETKNFGWGASQGENQGSLHHILGSRTSNQVGKPSPFNINNNFGWGATQQAAGPGAALWAAPPVLPKTTLKAAPKASSETIPKVLSKRSSVQNNGSNKYNLPPSCSLIPWSDLEDVLDRRINKPKILGSGAYGIVKLMKQTSSGRLCAVKINQDDVDEQTVIENMQSEVDVLTTLRNLDCVPELFGVTKPEGKTPLPVVVQEFIGDPKTFRSTTLAIAIQAKVLPAPKATRVALRVCEAVSDIHSRKLLHCDLKVDNIMLEPGFVRKSNPNIKIIDFGASVKMDDKPKYQYNSREEMQWILEWSTHIAPEVARGERPYNVSSEVYGLGMILQDLSFHFRGFLWRLGEECTDRDYRRRPSVEDVIQKIKTHLASIEAAASRLAAPSSN